MKKEFGKRLDFSFETVEIYKGCGCYVKCSCSSSSTKVNTNAKKIQKKMVNYTAPGIGQ